MTSTEQLNTTFTQSVQIKKKTIQLCSKQDYVYEGTSINPLTGETYCYGIVIDGHGANVIVAKIHDILNDEVETILNSETPHLEIQSRLEMFHKERIESAEENTIFYRRTRKYIEQTSYSGGSTFLFAKFYENRIEVFSVGDSEAYIMINNEIVYHNPVHNWSNESEQDRLSNRHDINIATVLQPVPIIISPERVGFSKCVCVDYYPINGNETITRLVPTQSLGHNSITQFAPEIMTISIKPSDAVKIVLATDGLWDVFAPDHPEDEIRLLEMDGEQLADLAESRWKQEWEVCVDYSNPDVLYDDKSKYPESSYDDIAVITMVRNPS